MTEQKKTNFLDAIKNAQAMKTKVPQGKAQQVQQAKMKKGGKVRRKNPTSSNNKMTRIARKASEIRMANESWRDAYNRAKSMVD